MQGIPSTIAETKRCAIWDAFVFFIRHPDESHFSHKRHLCGKGVAFSSCLRWWQVAHRPTWDCPP
jgi:hypothetical protein